jgi:uncharacterized membrane protein affecting hemolysin expression
MAYTMDGKILARWGKLKSSRDSLKLNGAKQLLIYADDLNLRVENIHTNK